MKNIILAIQSSASFRHNKYVGRQHQDTAKSNCSNRKKRKILKSIRDDTLCTEQK